MSSMDIQLHFDRVFDKWDISEVKIEDIGLEKLISLQPVSALHTGGRHAKQSYHPHHMVEKYMVRLRE